MKLKDSPPLAPTIPIRQWIAEDIKRQAEEYYANNPGKPEEAPLSKKRIATPRDNYGWKSL